jgi:hypothetical protein
MHGVVVCTISLLSIYTTSMKGSYVYGYVCLVSIHFVAHLGSINRHFQKYRVLFWESAYARGSIDQVVPRGLFYDNVEG